jgi:hypothetical protein
MRVPWLLAVLVLGSCVKPSPTPQVPFQSDATIIFPKFDDSSLQFVDQPGMPYDLDGVTLRALITALNDFLPSGSKDESCWDRPQSYHYRFIRQESIIFIHIYAHPASCHGEILLDSSVSYAIATDGRILRRLFAGQPDWSLPSAVPDAGANQGPDGGHDDAGEDDVLSVLKAEWARSPPFSRRDGGSPSADGGSPSADGGLPPPSK